MSRQCAFSPHDQKMKLFFQKYQGAGNDFIILDNRECLYDALTTEQVNFLCDRRFGIGADGLMLLNTHAETDFEMKYFNADGREGSMCGNGGRCLAAFAHALGLIKDHTQFMAIDGLHEAILKDNGWVELKMQDVSRIERNRDTAILDTGSPHYVKYMDRLAEVDVVAEGRKVRYNDRFAQNGINVNFVEYGPDALMIRTYERGVEDETLACGTGITAAAIVAAGNLNQAYEIPVKARGGNLAVRFDKIDDQHYSNIWLCGPAKFVFEGTIELEDNRMQE